MAGAWAYVYTSSLTDTPQSSEPTAIIPADWKTYSNNILGFSIGYPKDLILNESELNFGTSFGSLNIGLDPKGVKDIFPVLSVTALYDVSNDEVEQHLIPLGSKILSHTIETRTIGGYPATRHIFSVQSDDKGTVDFFWLPRGGSRGYVIQKGSYAEEDVFDQILETLRLIDLARNPEDAPLEIVSIGTNSRNGTKDKPLGAAVGWVSQFPLSINKKSAQISVDWGDGAQETVQYDSEKHESHWLKHGYSKAGDYTVTITVKAQGQELKELYFMHVQ